jgi:hypothetical protein
LSERKPIKLYFALLNRGWIRREVVAHQLPAMKNTAGVELLWEDPSLTWHHPIYSNRNKIVKRFLKTDCDFLMMQDSDVFPLGHNPAELVYANRDIIGCPAKVRSNSGTLDWVAYVWNDDAGGYVTVDMGRAPSHAELLEVDIVGTGLILIRRNVLEDPNMKAPFLVENDEDGVCDWGTDFAFCKRAKKFGYEVFTTPWRVCEHVKEMGFLDMDGYDETTNADYSNAKYGIAWGQWAIQQQDWRFIRDAMEKYGIKTVLEFGAGLSSLLMSERAKVVSYETDEDWMRDIANKCGKENDLTLALWDGAAINNDGFGMCKFETPPDMAFIDGPKGIMNGGPGREAAYRIAVERGPKFIITHDAGRSEEITWTAKYIRPKYDLVAKNGNHQTHSELWRLREV